MTYLRARPTGNSRLSVAVMLSASVWAIACSDDPVAVAVADDFPDEPAPAVQPELVAFVDVNVVPMDSDGILSRHTVLVRGNRIEAVGPVDQVTVPDDAFRIEGRGRYLMPGLVDMHVHLTSKTFANVRNDFMLFLANGVTTVRVMWGTRGVVAERDRIESGEILGPSLLVASPGLDGAGGTWTGSTPPVTTPAEAKERVAEHVTTGYDFIKVYNDLSRELYDAIVSEAAIHGIPIVGHVPWAVGIERAWNQGQLTLEHLIGIKLLASSPFTGGTLDMDLVRTLAAGSSSAGVWHTPTITVDALSQEQVTRIRTGPEIKGVSPGMRSFYTDGFYHGWGSLVAAWEETNHETIVRTLHEAGAGLLVGTDAGFGWILPGYSIHDELRHFVEAGLTPYEALRAATSDPARSVGRLTDFGVVSTGARGDLLLVAANPLEDLSRVRELSGVMVGGQWLSRGTLEDRITEITASYLMEP